MASAEKTLEKIGLSSNEVKVYLTLNNHGSTKAGKIAKITRLDRSSTYNALQMLLQKGFVSYALIGKVKWFQAVGPKRILDYIKEQEEEVNAILPELQATHKRTKIEGQVRLFKGHRGVKSVFLDIIRTGVDTYAFGSEGQLGDRMPDFAYQFIRMQNEKKIHTKLIQRKSRGKEVRSKYSEHRYLPSLAESPAVTNIYGNKVAIIIWTDDPEAIIIENAAAAKAYKSYFDVMWSKTKEIQ
jgi:sugar-specific transcriptional regulator TrmB